MLVYHCTPPENFEKIKESKALQVGQELQQNTFPFEKRPPAVYFSFDRPVDFVRGKHYEEGVCFAYDLDNMLSNHPVVLCLEDPIHLVRQRRWYSETSSTEDIDDTEDDFRNFNEEELKHHPGLQRYNEFIEKNLLIKDKAEIVEILNRSTPSERAKMELLVLDSVPINEAKIVDKALVAKLATLANRRKARRVRMAQIVK